MFVWFSFALSTIESSCQCSFTDLICTCSFPERQPRTTIWFEAINSNCIQSKLQMFFNTLFFNIRGSTWIRGPRMTSSKCMRCQYVRTSQNDHLLASFFIPSMFPCCHRVFLSALLHYVFVFSNRLHIYVKYSTVMPIIENAKIHPSPPWFIYR